MVCACLKWQGWEAGVDPDTGDTYFIDHGNRMTTWSGERFPPCYDVRTIVLPRGCSGAAL